MPELNPNDKAQLLESLKHWRNELNRRNEKLSAARKLQAQALKGKQLAQARVERRQSQLAKLSAHPGRQAAVKFALSQVGVTEHPAGSNRGPQVDKYQEAFGISGQPWCGAFVGWTLKHVGVGVTARIVYTPYIYEDALAHRNGLDHIVWSEHFLSNHTAHSGDLVLYDFGTPGGIKHVGMLIHPWNGQGLLQTVEGNTSFGVAGSQDNGGAVARRARDISLVHSIVSPRWP